MIKLNVPLWCHPNAPRPVLFTLVGILEPDEKLDDTILQDIEDRIEGNFYDRWKLSAMLFYPDHVKDLQKTYFVLITEYEDNYWKPLRAIFYPEKEFDLFFSISITCGEIDAST